jgi:hypothetical protein
MPPLFGSREVIIRREDDPHICKPLPNGLHTIDHDLLNREYEEALHLAELVRQGNTREAVAFARTLAPRRYGGLERDENMPI